MKKAVLAVGVFIVLCLLSLPAHASGTACFDWSCNQSTGTCQFNASCSTASPYIWKYEFNWGDGSGTGLTGNASWSHSYASPPPYDALVTLTIYFFSDPSSDTATCYVWPYHYPSGLQEPTSGRCQ